MTDHTPYGALGAAWARMNRGYEPPQLYRPDGVPIDGPVTTAAEYAFGGRRSAGWFTTGLSMYRNAAASEGERYSEAIAGARAMRSAAADVMDPEHDDPAQDMEKSHGSPWDFRAIVTR